MGERGPVPKRSSHRRRRNDPDGPPPKGGKGSGTEEWAAYADEIGVEVPEGASRSEIQALVAAESGSGLHPLAREWLDSLGQSGQSEFYEPSDWATAKVLAYLLSSALEADKVSAAAVERWQSGATELLTTEGARRRVRVELEKPDDEAEVTADVSELDEFRRRASRQGRHPPGGAA